MERIRSGHGKGRSTEASTSNNNVTGLSMSMSLLSLEHGNSHANTKTYSQRPKTYLQSQSKLESRSTTGPHNASTQKSQPKTVQAAKLANPCQTRNTNSVKKTPHHSMAMTSPIQAKAEAIRAAKPYQSRNNSSGKENNTQQHGMTMSTQSMTNRQAAKRAQATENCKAKLNDVSKRNSIQVGGRQEHATVSRPRGEIVNRDSSAKNVPKNNPATAKRNKTRPNSNTNNPIIEEPMTENDLRLLAQSNAADIISKLTNEKTEFMYTIDSLNDRNKLVLVMRILAKLCMSPSESEHKTNLLHKICNTGFFVHILCFLTNLPFESTRMKTSLYWCDQQQFWENFVIFFGAITSLSPPTSILKYRVLVDNCSYSCLDVLRDRHGFELSKELALKLTLLRQKLMHLEDNANAIKKATYKANDTAHQDPPGDFRFLSVVPTSEDLHDPAPFVRPNVVQGSYQNVEHYLDVQFRLLREDFFGPLREGIDQYRENPHRKSFDNIRIYQNVRFVGSFMTHNKIGIVIKVDDATVKQFTNTKWSESKRFIYGGLLLLTSDNCQTFIAAMVLDQDIKKLRKGMIPVSIVDCTGECDNSDIISQDVKYTMIECEIYYQSYFLALKALQERAFPKHLAMSQYIVNLNRETHPPAYLDMNTTFTVKTVQSSEKLIVLNPSTWPTSEKLGLNESQYNAYQLALTNEFTVIQGPPGTGKTFLAGKVAETLLNNGKYPMLVLCYTNHALDQFLESMLRKTKSIVRIGGQSRSEAMAEYNLTELRMIVELDCATKKMLWELGNDVRDALEKLQIVQEQIVCFNREIWRYDYLINFSHECKYLGMFYETHKIKTSDPLEHWLFEGHVEYMDIVDIEYLMDVCLHIEEQDDDSLYDDCLSQSNESDIEDTIQIPCYDDKLLPNISFLLDNAEENCEFLQEQCTKFMDKLDRDTLRSILTQVSELRSRIKLFEDMKKYSNMVSYLAVDENTNFAMLSTETRWLLYYRWAKNVLHHKQMEAQVLQATVQEAIKRNSRTRSRLDLNILRTKKVIGMTTSGATRLRELVIDLAPKIVIVEEAAEVLEQHIITSLTKDCQHLILIGDHQQLRPSASYMKLARDFNLEVSLFERMISNGVSSRRLNVQHRMRPEISALISPHIYQNLENHHSVETFPNVRGMVDNVFFMSHNYYEEEIVSKDGSKSNYKEAEIVLKLADYLMKQGYQPDEVTVLTPYSGQVIYMNKKRHEYSSFLSKIKITTVDNYQGEESRIILLSLVRNNIQGKIGFVGVKNRVCVALSRAREGLYIFGNINILKDISTLWRNISKTLENNDSLGSFLTLSCENHPEKITLIQSAKDFSKVPLGGCELLCNKEMKCGHICPLICHGYDNEHETEHTRCLLKCERVLCNLGHKCPKKCWDLCGPCSKVVVKTITSCGHSTRMPCHVEPADWKCTELLKVASPICGHEAEKMCHQDMFKAVCKLPCTRRVPECGHKCSLLCHGFDTLDMENAATFIRRIEIQCRCGECGTRLKEDKMKKNQLACRRERLARGKGHNDKGKYNGTKNSKRVVRGKRD